MTASTKIKICGVTRTEDAAHAARAGADFIGINLWPRSKRYVEAERAHELVMAARTEGPVQIVGLFVDATPDEVAAVMAQVDLDIVQLHGNETATDVAAIELAAKRPAWKAVGAHADALDAIASWPVDVLLLDTPTPGRGGSGTTFDWSIAKAVADRRPNQKLVLAGGLDPGNVARAIAEVSPWGVDVASGVESAPGVKDAEKVTAFVAAVRGRAR